METYAAVYRGLYCKNLDFFFKFVQTMTHLKIGKIRNLIFDEKHLYLQLWSSR